MDKLLELQMPKLLENLAAKGWAELPLAFSRSTCLALIDVLEERYTRRIFHAAKIGHGVDETSRIDIRSDSTLWLEKDDKQQAVQEWLGAIEELCLVLNQAFFFSTVDFNSHFSCYEIGAFYLRHLDRFQEKSVRVLSVMLYLNDQWHESDEGELLIYEDGTEERVQASIKPEMGTLVIFDSNTISHEVRATKRRRLSVTGWMTRSEAY